MAFIAQCKADYGWAGGGWQFSHGEEVELLLPALASINTMKTVEVNWLDAL